MKRASGVANNMRPLSWGANRKGPFRFLAISLKRFLANCLAYQEEEMKKHRSVGTSLCCTQGILLNSIYRKQPGATLAYINKCTYPAKNAEKTNTPRAVKDSGSKTTMQRTTKLLKQYKSEQQQAIRKQKMFQTQLQRSKVVKNG